jgi:HAD superfamily hydrolase (TIGR01549 family)
MESIINKTSFDQLIGRDLILDFDGVLTKLNPDWQLLRLKLQKIAGSEKIFDYQSLYLLARVRERLDKFIKEKEETEMNSLDANNKSELFLYLKSKDLKFSIFSTNCKSVIRKFLELNNMLENTQEIVSFEDVVFLKPNPEGLRKILKDNSLVNPLYIGDTIQDEISAKLAGVEFKKYAF